MVTCYDPEELQRLENGVSILVVYSLVVTQFLMHIIFYMAKILVGLSAFSTLTTRPHGSMGDD